jgi:hypothetical protein
MPERKDYQRFSIMQNNIMFLTSNSHMIFPTSLKRYRRLQKVTRIFVETIRSANITGMPCNKSYAIEGRATNPTRLKAAQQILRAGRPRNKPYALEGRATNSTRWKAAQQILRAGRPCNKSYALEGRATNPTRWNAAQQIFRAGMPRNKTYALECRARNPTH